MALMLDSRKLPRIRDPLWIVGLDLGQRRDYTALAILLRTDRVRVNPDGQGGQRETRYAVKQLVSRSRDEL